MKIKNMMMICLLELFLLSYILIRNKHIFFVCRLANIFGRNHENSPAREMTIDNKSNRPPLSKEEKPSSKNMPTKTSCRGLNHTTKDTTEERKPTVELFDALYNLCK